jgi:pimeloyl-ACP methyl ester carboxylesterase
VVGGSADGLISVKEFQQTSKHYGAELEIIEGGSHDLMLDEDKIELTVRVIREWVNS